MKKVRTPEENLEIIFGFLSDTYFHLDKKKTGIIQLYIAIGNETSSYILAADGKLFTWQKGVKENAEATLTITYENWIKLSSGKLNPFIGVVSGKMKVSGNKQAFKRVIPNKFLSISKSFFNDDKTPFEKKPDKNWTPPNNVVFIEASPRGLDGYNYTYFKNFTDGMLEANPSCNISTINLSEYNLNHCDGCLKCWTVRNGSCIYNDNGNSLINTIAKADMVIFAFPLFTYSVPGILKDLLDRMASTVEPFIIGEKSLSRHPRRYKQNQSLVILSTSGFPETANFKSVSMLFRQISHSIHAPIVAEIYRSASIYIANNPIHHLDYIEILKNIRLAGKEVMLKGKLSKKLQKKISRNTFSIKKYRDSSNLNWFYVLEKGETDY